MADEGGPTQEPIEYGPARLREVVEIARLYRGQSAEDRLRFHPLPFGALPLGAALAVITIAQHARQLGRRIAPGVGALLWVARLRDDRRVVGFLIGRLRGGPSGPVVRTGLMVAPTARRLGIGAGLKRAILEEGRRLGLRRMEALLLPTNAAALGLHAALGSEVRPVVFRDRRSEETRYLLASQEILPEAAAPGSCPPAPGAARTADAR